MAKIDVLLPYWGEFSLLTQAVDSVLEQTFEDWRLVVLDDCYPSDEAKKYFSKIKDSRVIYIRNKTNLGITKNFNKALSLAEAEYCIMFGRDDVMLPDHLEKALQLIGQADLYQSRVNVIDGNGNEYLPLGDRVKRLLRPRKAGIFEGEKLAASLCNGNWLYFPSIVWKTSVIRKYGFDENYKILEDVVLELNMIKDGCKLFLSNETTFQYRRFNESLSSKEKSKNGVRFTEEAEVYTSLSKSFKSIGWRRAYFSAMIRFTSRVNWLLSKLAFYANFIKIHKN